MPYKAHHFSTVIDVLCFFFPGSRGALVNMEARGEQASMLNRKCVIVRWAELSIEKLLEVVERGAGSILILLPPDMNSVNEELIEVCFSCHKMGGVVILFWLKVCAGILETRPSIEIAIMKLYKKITCS